MEMDELPDEFGLLPSPLIGLGASEYFLGIRARDAGLNMWRVVPVLSETGGTTVIHLALERDVLFGGSHKNPQVYDKCLIARIPCESDDGIDDCIAEAEEYDEWLRVQFEK